MGITSRLYNVPLEVIETTKNFVSGVIGGSVGSFTIPSEMVRYPGWLYTREDDAYNTGRCLGYVLTPTVVTGLAFHDALNSQNLELAHPEALIPLGVYLGTNTLSFLYERIRRRL